MAYRRRVFKKSFRKGGFRKGGFKKRSGKRYGSNYKMSRGGIRF